jgi:histidinol dehydrogenase
VLEAVNAALQQQLTLLPRSKTAAAALQNSRFILVNHLTEGMELLNEYAPEHLIIACREPEIWAERVVNAGSVFLGNYAPESAGDYASGTNHTLPTSGFAKAYSGVSVDSFVKKITFQQLSRTGLQHIGPSVMAMAGAEGLHGHANAVALRMKDILPANEQNGMNYEL